MEISSSVCGAAAVAACAAVAGGAGRGAVQAVSAATAAASRRRRSIIASVYVAVVTCRSHRCAGVVEDAARLVADSGGSRASVIREPALCTKNCGQHGGARRAAADSLPALQRTIDASAADVGTQGVRLLQATYGLASCMRPVTSAVRATALAAALRGACQGLMRRSTLRACLAVRARRSRPRAHPRRTRTAAALAQLSGQTDLRQPRLQPGAPTPAATSLPAAARPVWSAARRRSRSVRHWHR